MSVSTAPVPVLIKSTASTVASTSTVSDGDLKKAVDCACNMLSNLESAMHEVRKLSSARHAYTMNRKFGHLHTRLVRVGGKFKIQISLGGHKWVGYRELKSSHPSIQTVALALVANQQNRIENAIERLEEARQKKVAQRKELSDMVKEIKATDALSAAVDLLLDTQSAPVVSTPVPAPVLVSTKTKLPSARDRAISQLMEDQSLTRDQARAWFKDVVFEKGKPASPMPALFNDNGLIYNKSARKCIDKCQENEYSLFTYKKVSDEIYSVPQVQVSEEKAFAWLRSDG